MDAEQSLFWVIVMIIVVIGALFGLIWGILLLCIFTIGKWADEREMCELLDPPSQDEIQP